MGRWIQSRGSGDVPQQRKGCYATTTTNAGTNRDVTKVKLHWVILARAASEVSLKAKELSIELVTMFRKLPFIPCA